MKKSFREVMSWVVLILFAGGIIGGVMYFNSQFTVYQITSGSMEPTLPVGTVAVGQDNVDHLEKFDIITFQKDGDLVTHTFVGYADDGSLMTKGDANATLDVHTTPLQESDVVAKLAWVFPQSLAPSFWTSPRGIAIIAIAVATILYLVFGRNKKKSDMDNSEETRELTPSDPSIA